MENATHIITTVEPVNMMELYKEHQSSLASVRLDIAKKTFEKLMEYLEVIFDKYQSNPVMLLELMETAKDLECHAVSGNIMDYVKEEFPDVWQAHLKGNKSDHSSADGSDNR